MHLRGAPSVLVLDAFDDECDMCAEYLRATGFDAHVFRHPDDALKAAAEKRPDVVVTRLRQSSAEITGIDVVRHLRQDALTHDVPVVMITTSMLPGDRKAATDARDAYLLLPVLPDRLVAEIRSFVTPSGPTLIVAKYRHSDDCLCVLMRERGCVMVRVTAALPPHRSPNKRLSFCLLAINRVGR